MNARPNALVLLAAACGAWLAFALLVWIYGESPASMARLLFEGTWGTSYGIGQVLFKATPLLFTGVAVDVALKAGLFNIGAEGQLQIASLVAGLVGASAARSLPWPIAIPFVLACAAFAGGAWAVVPAILRARFGAHEVITTIMMNKVADACVGLVLGYGFALKGTVRTANIAASARLLRLDRLPMLSDLRGSAASIAFFLALLIAAFGAFWSRRTRIGREVSLVGLNPVACRAEHIPVARRLAQAMILSGAIAGLASAATVLGYKGYFEEGLGAGAGFGGIAVAMLARGSASWLVMASLLFGTLEQGGLAMNAHVPMEVSDIMQGVVIVAVALADAQVRRLVFAGRR